MNAVHFVKVGWIWTADVFTLSLLFLRENLLEELDEDHGRVEVKEYCQWKCHSLDDDPRHKTVEIGLNQIGPHFLNLEWRDKPLCKV